MDEVDCKLEEFERGGSRSRRPTSQKQKKKKNKQRRGHSGNLKRLGIIEMEILSFFFFD